MELPDVLFEYAPGAIRLTGSRIGLEHVLELHTAGQSVDDIRETFPDLPIEQLTAVIDFSGRNTAAVDAYLREYEAAGLALKDMHPPGPALKRIRAALAVAKAEPEPAS